MPDKTRRNFFEYFYYSAEPFTGAPARDKAAEARAKLDALFRKREWFSRHRTIRQELRDAI